MFSIDDAVLATFDFEGSLQDGSGAGRHAKIIGGMFVDGVFGQALAVTAGARPMGIDWSAHAGLLTPPYTVEMVLTPQDTAHWSKLFGGDDANDHGLYYKSEGVQLYPSEPLARGRARPGVLHYIALVVGSDGLATVYLQGERIGEVAAPSLASPTQALFFRDDEATGRAEQLTAVIEALRISRGARDATEIAETWLGLKRGFE